MRNNRVVLLLSSTWLVSPSPPLKNLPFYRHLIRLHAAVKNKMAEQSQFSPDASTL